MILVYWLHQNRQESRCTARISKIRGSLVQAPGCSKEDSNGIVLPDFICNPITLEDLNQNWLDGWNEACDRIIGEIRYDDNTNQRSDDDCVETMEISNADGMIQDNSSVFKDEDDSENDSQNDQDME